MPRKKQKPLPLTELYIRLKALGAPLSLRADAGCLSFDVLWRKASVDDKVWLLKATDRWAEPESADLSAHVDGLYTPAPMVIEKKAPPRPDDQQIVQPKRRVPGTPVPVRVTPLESDEFFDPPEPLPKKVRAKRTVWPKTPEKDRKTWVPPHMRPPKTKKAKR